MTERATGATTDWFNTSEVINALSADPDRETSSRKRMVIDFQVALAKQLSSGPDPGGIDQTIERYTSAHYRDNDPRVGPGREEVARFFKEGGFGIKPPACIACLAEPGSPLVATLVHAPMPDPTRPGRVYDLFMCNYWSVDGDRITVHWASGEDLMLSNGKGPLPPPEVYRAPALEAATAPDAFNPLEPAMGGYEHRGGLIKITDPRLYGSWFDRADYLSSLSAHHDADVAARKRLVVDFQAALARGVRAGSIGAEIDSILATYLSDDYVQNDPNIADGPNALAAFFRAGGFGDTPPATIVCSAELDSDLVSTMSTIPIPNPGRSGEQIDLYICSYWRVRDGRIVEHWASRSKLPPMDQTASS